MAMPCKVCSHPDRNTIDRLLAEPFCVNRDVARRFKLTPHAVGRHSRDHVPRRLAAAVSNGSALSARSLLERVESVVTKLEGLVEQSPEPAALLGVVAQLRPYHELLGRVTRELQPDTVVNVSMALFQRLGVRDEAEAAQVIEAQRKYRELPEPELAERMREWLARYDAAKAQEGPKLQPGTTNGDGQVVVVESGDGSRS